MYLTRAHKAGLVDKEAEPIVRPLPAEVRTMLGRWAIWYGRRIDVDIAQQVAESEVAHRHARIYAEMIGVDDGGKKQED